MCGMWYSFETLCGSARVGKREKENLTFKPVRISEMVLANLTTMATHCVRNVLRGKNKFPSELEDLVYNREN